MLCCCVVIVFDCLFRCLVCHCFACRMTIEHARISSASSMKFKRRKAQGVIVVAKRANLAVSPKSTAANNQAKAKAKAKRCCDIMLLTRLRFCVILCERVCVALWMWCNCVQEIRYPSEGSENGTWSRSIWNVATRVPFIDFRQESVIKNHRQHDFVPILVLASDCVSLDFSADSLCFLLIIWRYDLISDLKLLSRLVLLKHCRFIL